jgi:hypothetical protein
MALLLRGPLAFEAGNYLARSFCAFLCVPLNLWHFVLKRLSRHIEWWPFRQGDFISAAKHID